MTVDTKKVARRREVHYNSYDDLLADAERLASSDVQTVGNWTLGQIFKHLAQSLNSSIDGTDTFNLRHAELHMSFAVPA